MESTHDPTRNHQLDTDMVYEILSRSSFKTLAKCRLLSKHYNRLTYESSFTNLQSRRTHTVAGFFFQTIKYNKSSATFISPQGNSTNLSLDFLPCSSVTIKASSVQGILVCVDHSNRRIPRYYVCKPFTREWQLIPNPKTRCFTEKIGIKVLKAKPLHYKIVRLSQPKQAFVGLHYCLRCQIFDSISGKWRQIEQVKLPYDEQLSCRNNAAISASGKLHWLTTENNVLAFDVDDEKYCLFPLPCPVYDEKYHYGRVQLTDYESKLGLIRKQDNSFELWVMEQKEWRKRLTVSTDSVKREEASFCDPVAFCNSDVAVVPGFYRLLFFKFKNGTSIDKVRMDDSNINPPEIFPFRSDSEHCNLKNEFFNKQSSGKRRRN